MENTFKQIIKTMEHLFDVLSSCIYKNRLKINELETRIKELEQQRGDNAL